MSLLIEMARVWSGCFPGQNARRTLTEAEAEERCASAHRIACPVLASMYRAGLLNPTPSGIITWQDLFAGLRAIGFCRSSAMFQAFGIASYRASDPQQTLRDRGGVHRFLNIFQMSPGETSKSASMQVQHGFSTVIRDSRNDDGAESLASIRASREARFNEIFGQEGIFRTEDGERRCYLDGLSRVLSHLKQHGDKSGEWSSENLATVHPSAAKKGFASEMHEWQPLFAFCACWCAFGQTDAQGHQYMSESALQSMYLDSHVPQYWKEGHRFGFKEGLEAVAALGSETSLLLPAQVQAEVLSTCTVSRVHMAIKFAQFLAKRGIGDDPDPPSPPEPLTAVDWVVRVCMGVSTVLALLYGWGGVLQLSPFEGASSVVGGFVFVLAILPTLLLLHILFTKVKKALGGGGSNGGQGGSAEALLQ